MRDDVTRRAFLAVAGATLALQDAPSVSGPGPGAPTRLCTIAYNVYGFDGWPENRANRERLQAARSQMPARIALELALHAPDIVTLSEAGSEASVAAVAQALNMRHVYFDGGFPGACLSCFPILESANHSLPSKDIDAAEPFTRHAGRAVLDAPGGPLIVFSVHLHPISREIRLREIAQIRTWIQADLDADTPLLVQGDLNHAPDSPEYAAWREAGLMDAFAMRGVGGEGTVRSNNPTMRIDYIWAHGPLAQRLRQSRTLFEGAFRVNPDDPASFALSDHLPVMAEFDL